MRARPKQRMEKKKQKEIKELHRHASPVINNRLRTCTTWHAKPQTVQTKVADVLSVFPKTASRYCFKLGVANLSKWVGSSRRWNILLIKCSFIFHADTNKCRSAVRLHRHLSADFLCINAASKYQWQQTLHFSSRCSVFIVSSALRGVSWWFSLKFCTKLYKQLQ